MAQVALAFVLVIGAGLMVRSFEALRSVDPGFSADGMLTFEVRPLPTKYADGDAVAQFYDRLLERLEAVPGVMRAGAINALPLAGGGMVFDSAIEEFPPPEGELAPAFSVRRATPGYFEAMGIPVVEGRAFTPDDHNLRLTPSSSAAPSRTGTGRMRVRSASASTSRTSRRKSSASSATCTMRASICRRNNSCTCRCSTPRTAPMRQPR